MNQFNIINGNAKSVRTDLVNSILTATAAKKETTQLRRVIGGKSS